MGKLDRRAFLVSVAAAAGGAVFAFDCRASAPVADANGKSEVTAWIVVEADDTVIVRVARSEMGQGILTSLPMLVAEELECDWTKVRAEYAEAHDNLRRGRVWGDMATGASRSISASHEDLRRAGATARTMLVAAAAQRWGVSPEQCRAAQSVIEHLPTGRRLRFGEVAALAATVPSPNAVVLKDPSEWRLIGTARRNFGAAEKVTGRAVYGIDVHLPGMLHAAIAQCPVFGGRLRRADKSKATELRGVHRVLELPDAVVVVAETWWRAKTALERLTVEWDTTENGALSGETIAAELRSGLDATEADVGREDGDAAGSLATAAKRVEAEYAVPFLAHATMEPQNCTAHVTADRVEIWVPTQDAEWSLATAAAAADVAPEKVVVHRTAMGGGFGRRGVSQDFVQQAVTIAKEVGRPVKLLWTREEDIRHDFYRPAAMARQSAGVDSSGQLVAWDTRLSAPSILADLTPETTAGGFDRTALHGWLEDMPYEVPNYRAAYAMRNTPVPVGMWRSVNHSQNAFFRECFLDEVAHAAGEDPYIFRRKLLRNNPKHLAVLDAAAKHAGWDRGSAFEARGIALHDYGGTVCCQVAEVSVSGRGRIRVHRVVSAIDPGYVVNPRGIEAQVESAVVYALTATLFGEVSIANGSVAQSNFDDYEMLRLAETPRIETVIVPSGGFWGGVGEIGVPPLAPAVCNAVFAATGIRVRSLPLAKHDLRRV